MKKVNLTKVKELAVQPERVYFKNMLAKNPNYFGNIKEQIESEFCY